MDDTQIIKRAILPYIKGLPIILIIVIGTVVLVSRLVNYMTPMYESYTKIKIENHSEGINSLELYKDFDVFHLSSKIKTEVELIKSKELIKDVALKMGFTVRYYRHGDMQTSEMYNTSPFVVSHYELDQSLFGQELCISILDTEKYILSYGEESTTAAFSDTINFRNSRFVIKKRDQIIKEKGIDILVDDFVFMIYNTTTMVNLLKANLDVSNKDEEIPIIRVSYKDEIPERAAFIVNSLVHVYINDYITTKTEAARKTVAFIDDQLVEVSKELSESEIKLEQFKREFNVVNTKQETETGLREISQLQLNMISLEIEKAAMDSVLVTLNNPANDTLAIPMNFEAFADLVFTEVVNDLNTLLAHRRELLYDYQPANHRVALVNQQINDLKAYLKDGIEKSKISKETRIRGLQKEINLKEQQFIDLPEREKKLIILEREFMLNQKIYTFLSEKRVESAITQAARISFHRIIEKGEIPRKPVSPNKKFLVIIAGFLAFLTSMALIYIKTQFAGKTASRVDIEHASTVPVIGITREYKRHSPEMLNDFVTIINEMLAKEIITKNQLIVISSASRYEGKTFVAEQLARAFDALEWKTALVDFNMQNSTLSQSLGLGLGDGLLQLSKENSTYDNVTYHPFENQEFDFIPTGAKNKETNEILIPLHTTDSIISMAQDHDIVIVDTPANTITNQALMLTKKADCVIHIVRGNTTPSYLLSQGDILQESYGLKNINLLYNSAPKATNYNGLFSGSSFEYDLGKGIIPTFKRYFRAYLKR